MDANVSNTSSTSLETKYQKLATEYSKVRGQASVLKRGLLDEQHKSAALRDTLRQRDTSLRRCEQELDSLGFRNKQLEHRVSALQDDLRRDPRSLLAVGAVATATTTETTSPSMSAGRAGQQQQQQHLSAAVGGHCDLALLSDELRMRIVENARLAMQLADQTGDQQRLADRCAELERRSSRQQAEHAELERRLRADLDVMCGRAAELERRLSSSGNNINSGSAACSEDTLSVSDDRELSSTAATGNGDATAAVADASLSSEASMAAGVVVQQLQRELFQARTQLEFAAVRCIPAAELAEKTSALRRASNGPLGAPWTVSRREAKEAAAAKQAEQTRVTAAAAPTQVDGAGGGSDSTLSDAVEREKWVQRHFSEKLDRLFAEKLEAESRADSYVKECENLQSNMLLLNDELATLRLLIERTQSDQHCAEEDMATTRLNYEEQISVLTEQLISLSDQLAMAAS